MTDVKKNANQMTRAEFEALPWRKAWDKEVECRSLIILPSRGKLHDSGYRFIDVVAVGLDGPMCRVAGGSDVIHIDGIGGFGQWDPAKGVPRLIPPSGWAIDCLAKSGLLQLWPSSRLVIVGAALSSLEVYAVPLERGK